MTNVEVRDPDALPYAIEHHARDLFPMAAMLMFGYTTKLLPRGWKLKQSREGANSWSIYRGNRQFHFRSIPPYTKIYVFAHYQHGEENPIYTIGTRGDALAFIRKLERM